MTRLRAIALAAFYGIAPYWLYEDRPHYAPMSYLGHLWLNSVYSLRWLTFREDEGDWRFEREVNGRTGCDSALR